MNLIRNNSVLLKIICPIFFLLAVGIKVFANNIFLYRISVVLFFINTLLLSWLLFKINLINNLKNIKDLKINIWPNMLSITGMAIGILMLRKTLLDGTVSMYLLLVNLVLFILIFLNKNQVSPH